MARVVEWRIRAVANRTYGERRTVVAVLNRRNPHDEACRQWRRL